MTHTDKLQEILEQCPFRFNKKYLLEDDNGNLKVNYLISGARMDDNNHIDYSLIYPSSTGELYSDYIKDLIDEIWGGLPESPEKKAKRLEKELEEVEKKLKKAKEKVDTLEMNKVLAEMYLKSQTCPGYLGNNNGYRCGVCGQYVFGGSSHYCIHWV